MAATLGSVGLLVTTALLTSATGGKSDAATPKTDGDALVTAVAEHLGAADRPGPGRRRVEARRR